MRSCMKKAPMRQHGRQGSFLTVQDCWNRYRRLAAPWTMTPADANWFSLSVRVLLCFVICGTEGIRLLLSVSGTAKKAECRTLKARRHPLNPGKDAIRHFKVLQSLKQPIGRYRDASSRLPPCISRSHQPSITYQWEWCNPGSGIQDTCRGTNQWISF